MYRPTDEKTSDVKNREKHLNKIQMFEVYLLVQSKFNTMLMVKMPGETLQAFTGDRSLRETIPDIYDQFSEKDASSVNITAYAADINHLDSVEGKIATTNSPSGEKLQAWTSSLVLLGNWCLLCGSWC